MRKIITVTAVAAAGLAGLGGAAYAAAGTGGCTNVRDHIAKTDNGHGTPPEWADLSMDRTTRVCPKDGGGYTVTLTDVGGLRTRVGAGTPNGTGGQITHRVHGRVRGVYHLTVTGGTLEDPPVGDVTKSSTDYVRSLFSEDATVTGGDYAWAYATRCERWLDSSKNNDGQGEQAGNITGKRCARPHPTPSDSGTTSPTPSGSPSPSTPPGEAPAPTPVPSNLPVTG